MYLSIVVEPARSQYVRDNGVQMRMQVHRMIQNRISGISVELLLDPALRGVVARKRAL